VEKERRETKRGRRTEKDPTERAFDSHGPIYRGMKTQHTGKVIHNPIWKTAEGRCLEKEAVLS
jgi:hypothetical protein